MMKKFLRRILKKKSLLFDKQGVYVKLSDGKEFVINWNKVNKIVFLDVFEEYSGYFLTEDYLSRTIYHDISIACRQNIVKVRTGGAPSVKKNISEPFSKKFGTTSIYYPVFVEYIDGLGNKNIFAEHYDEYKKDQITKQLEVFLSKDKIKQKNKIEGFTPLSQY